MKDQHSQIKKLEYDEIIDGIYIGTNQCCQDHWSEVLKKENIKVDISLEEDKIDKPFGVKFFVWLPTKDETPPSPDQMEFGISAIKKFVKMGKKIYVHCMNGHTRAPTLVAAYLIKTKNYSVSKANDFIKSKRPSIHIEPPQIKALEELK